MVAKSPYRCGNFGCPLPNLHKGICQPLLATRSCRSDVRNKQRQPTSYLQKRKAPQEGKPKPKIVPIGPTAQVDALPEWRCGPCIDADRGDALLRLDTKAEIQACFRLEKEAAAAWEALDRDDNDTSGPDLSIEVESTASSPKLSAVTSNPRMLVTPDPTTRPCPVVSPVAVKMQASLRGAKLEVVEAPSLAIAADRELRVRRVIKGC